ncbi:phage baseplate assembly protein V [Acetomicrobium sp. S15 = DSM 107314]|uniref:phage baseplate assembly protein V n=1 Tax=Acetomicrobium sp. S15 = DSM 107314 TaxID=2529858 RepID=UPI0018E1CDE6|nr:phage baseplate assembly protein V [Acetomicrobium sp. S15 = DSM 107314]
MIRIGIVSSIDAEKGTARVIFDDLDNLVSYNLPILFPATLKNKAYHMLDIGEHVVCAFLDNGLEKGVILGAIYSGPDAVPIADSNIWHLSIPGGAAIEINRATHELVIVDSFGSRIVFREGDILIKAAKNIHINPSDAPIPSHLNNIFE